MSLEKQLNLLKKRRGVTSTQNRAPAGRRRVGARTKATGNPNGEGTGGQEGAGDAAPARSGTHRTHYLGGPSQTKAAPAQTSVTCAWGVGMALCCPSGGPNGARASIYQANPIVRQPKKQFGFAVPGIS